MLIAIIEKTTSSYFRQTEQIITVVDARVIWAQKLAITGLAIFAVYHIDEVMKASSGSGFLPITNPVQRSALFEIPSLTLSATAFAFSWRRPSIIVTMVLFITGILMTADGIAIGTRYLSVLTVPGPVIGLFYGIAVLIMAVIKGITTVRAMKTPKLSHK